VKDRDLYQAIEAEYPGSCNPLSIDIFAEKLGVSEYTVAAALDQMEIFECVGCGWWFHSGEIFLGHSEDCEGSGEMLCAECCGCGEYQ